MPFAANQNPKIKILTDAIKANSFTMLSKWYLVSSVTVPVDWLMTAERNCKIANRVSFNPTQKKRH
jgi:hypothetical protein